MIASAALVLGLAACASPDPGTAPASTVPRTEVAGPRIGVTYDGGVLVLDRDTLAVVADLPLEGFLRLNAGGDERHLLVSTAEGFRVLDTGVEPEVHGDHAHYYDVGAPTLTDVTWPAPEPGHAVEHDGHLALFSDGAGTAQVVDADDVASGTPERTFTSASPHHGVAVPLPGGQLLVSLGTTDERVGAQVVAADGTEVARSEECPGVHGEATAGEGDDAAVVLGCEDGVLLWRDGAFTKIDAPGGYARTGNQIGSPESPIVLGDRKTDPEADLERPEQVTLVNTSRGTLRVVDLGTSYSFRSLGRGPDGEAVVLGTDGALHVLDPATGKREARIPVVDAWREPSDWQRPRPTLRVDGAVAYVTEPRTSEIHVVDLGSQEVVDTVTLPHVPNEISTTG